jgi:hypothetical protein
MMQTTEAIWNEVSMEQLQNLIASMPRRIEAIISAKDAWKHQMVDSM